LNFLGLGIVGIVREDLEDVRPNILSLVVLVASRYPSDAAIICKSGERRRYNPGRELNTLSKTATLMH
jgi:putative N-acetylmannosamine-6-phosphate epimerase